MNTRKNFLCPRNADAEDETSGPRFLAAEASIFTSETPSITPFCFSSESIKIYWYQIHISVSLIVIFVFSRIFPFWRCFYRARYELEPNQEEHMKGHKNSFLYHMEWFDEFLSYPINHFLSLLSSLTTFVFLTAFFFPFVEVLFEPVN